MPFAVATDVPVISRRLSSSFDFQGVQANRNVWDTLGVLDVMARPIDTLQVGSTRYPLTTSLTLRAFPGISPGAWECVVDEFGSAMVGQGSNLSRAARDCREKIHQRFQELLAKRPFEMSVEDKSAWNMLTTYIDLAAYKCNTPFVVRQFGKVEKARPLPEEIRWDNGRTERVNLKRMPSEFVTYKAGQWFEALVSRNPVTFRLIKVHYTRRSAEPKAMSKSEIAAFCDQLPTTQELPDTDWD